MSAAPLRLGIVGLGLAGGVMAAAVRSHAGFVLAAGADANADMRTRFAAAHAVPVFDSIEALLERAALDVVYIATPHHLHREQAVLAAAHGRHVLVEKPMALALADCDAMIAAAQAAGVVLMVGHTHGFDPALQVMREAMRTLGPVASVLSLNYTDFLYRPRRPEDLDTTLGGGIVFNQLPHQIDMVRGLVDAPLRSVRAVCNALDPARPTEGGCNALLVFDNGACATLVYSGYDGFDSDELHDWIGEGGHRKTPAHGAARRQLAALASPDEEQSLRRSRYGAGSASATDVPSQQPHFGLLLATCAHGDLRCSADGVMTYSRAGMQTHAVPATPWRAGRGDVLEALRRAIAGEPVARHDGAFGRSTLQTCLALLRSAREQREVALQEVA